MNKNTFLFILLLLFLSFTAWAQTAVNSSEDFIAMSNNGNYYLTTDLVLDQWTPGMVFSGVLDGRGHTITINGCQVGSNGYGSLFGITTDAEISNLIVAGNIYGVVSLGGSIVARAINTTFRNCESEALVHSDEQGALLGGLVGVMNGGSMVNCSSNAILEGYKMGGLVGRLEEQAVIKNCYSSTCFVYTLVGDETQIGGLVHTNNGTIENSYTRLNYDEWYIASIGQLELLYATKSIQFSRNQQNIFWADGYCMSSSLTSAGYVLYIDEDGVMGVDAYGTFNQAEHKRIRYVHDFHGIGHNIGDIVYVNGIKTFVFYINDEGTGGWVTPCLDNTMASLFTFNANNALDGYYVNKLYFEAMDYDYAQWHDGHTVEGNEVNVIEEGYDNSPGKFFTFRLQENDNRVETKVNNIELVLENYTPMTAMKQLAYENTGEIRNCFYPMPTKTYGQTSGAAAVQCSRFGTSAVPYNYGQFGPYLYKANGTSTTDLALVDTLNAWVKTQGSDEYSYWATPGTKQVNGNHPIHKYAFSLEKTPVNTAMRLGWYFRKKALRYADINSLADEQKRFKVTLAYYGSGNTVNADNVTVPWAADLFVTENAAMIGDYLLRGTVGFTMDNSDASGFAGAEYDWHMVSSVLSNAPVGIYYQIYSNGGPFNNPSQVKFTNENGYFPVNTPYKSWDFYCYDEPHDGWPNFKRKTGDHYHHDTGEPVSYTNETNLIPGKGYLWAIDKKTGFQAYGTLNNGTVERDVTCQGGIYPGYNLVGNPYQAYLDFDVFARQNSSMLAQSAYSVLDADRQGYVTYCPGASTNPVYASRYLNPHQGFFIQVNADGVVSFTTRQAVFRADTYFRDKDYPLVNLVVTDEAGKKDYATVELDRPSDGGATKMKGIHICDGELAISHASEEYSIVFVEGRPESVPVRFRAFADGAYTLRWDPLHEDFAYLHLVDHVTGKEVDCLSETEYVFQASTDDYASRFMLLFSPTAVPDAPDVATNSFAFFSNGTIVAEGHGRLELFDLQGRLLSSATIDGECNSMSIPDLAKGVYLLRLTNSTQSNTQKIIIP